MLKRFHDLSDTAKMVTAAIGLLVSGVSGGWAAHATTGELSALPAQVRQNTQSIESLERRVGATEQKMDDLLCLAVAEQKQEPWEPCLRDAGKASGRP